MNTSRIQFCPRAMLMALIFFFGTHGLAVAQQRQLQYGVGKQFGKVPLMTQSRARASAATANLPQRRDVRYTVKQIGVLPGYESSYLPINHTINNNGVVAGYSYNGAFAVWPDFALTATAFIGKPDKLKALPKLNGWPGAFAAGLNDNNQVFGYANKLDELGQFKQTPVLWDHGIIKELPTLPGSIYTEIDEINNRGDMVGYFYLPGDVPFPIMWHDGKVKQLPLPAGAVNGWSQAINDWGEIIGTAVFPNGVDMGGNQVFDFHLYAWMPWGDDPVGVDLGSNFWGAFGQVWDVNNLSQMVGSAVNTAIEYRGFIWNWGSMKEIGLPGSIWSEMWSINNWGQVLGIGDRADGQAVCILAQHSDVSDLNTLVPADTPLLTTPSGINDWGVIATVSFTEDGRT
ncbi:MAG: hypothetical protein U0V70_22005 [Terriglobia bacterium]